MNKKLTKLLSIFLMAGLIGAGTALVVTGCNKNSGSGTNQNQTTEYNITFDMNGHGTDIESVKTKDGKLETIPTPEGVEGDYTFDGWYLPDGTTKVTADTVFTQDTTITARWTLNEVTSVTAKSSRGKLYSSGNVYTVAELTAELEGNGNFNTDVTWEITEGASLAEIEGNVLTAVAKGTVKVQATSVMSSVKSNVVEIIIEDVPTVPTVEADRALVPAYVAPAAGPEAGTRTITPTLIASELDTGVIEDEWTDGTFTLIKGNIRERSRTGVYDYDDSNISLEAATSFSKSFSMASADDKILIEAPARGTLTLYLENGSSGESRASYMINAPGSTVNETFKVATGKVVKKVFTYTRPGTITIARNSGTTDIFKIVLSYEAAAAPIQSIAVTNPGTGDYLLTQKLDCTAVKVMATDANGTKTEAPLSAVKFDTSKYNPNFPGEYEIGVKYFIDSNLESQTTEFETTYKVRVFGINSIYLTTTKMVSNSKQEAVQMACLPGATFSTDNLTVYGVCQLGSEIIERKLQADWYTVSTPDLTTEGEKIVTVKVAPEFTSDIFEVAATYGIIVKAKQTAVNNEVTVTVGKSGDFKTITQAVQYIEACAYTDNVTKIIKVEAGVYEEKVWIYANNVTLIGMGEHIDDTVLTWSAVEDTTDPATGAKYGLNCATLQVDGKDFKAYNINIRNDFDFTNEYLKYGSPQGLALTINGDGAVVYNCHLYGNQDTLYLKNGRSYFYKTQIDGNIDFIFGQATGLAYFDDCTIVAICGKKAGSDQNGYVTAMKADTADKPDYGYIFNNCHFTSDDINGEVADGSMSLGRTWGAKATVSYINCDFTAVYSTKGYGDEAKTTRWGSMNGSPVDADFSEFGSTGAGAISTAVAGGRILTAEQAANYTKENIFAATNGNCKWSAAWNCDAALDALIALVDPSNYATVTVKDTEGSVIATFSVKKGTTLSADAVLAVVNPALASDDKEVDKIYSAYSNADTNTEYTAVAVNDNLDVIVSLKNIQYTEKVYTLIEIIPSKLTYSDTPIDIYNGELYLEGGSLSPNDNSGCCIANPGTVITFDLVGEVTLAWYNGGTETYGQDSDAKITYKDHKATITIGNRLTQYYLKQIFIDLTQTPTDTPEKENYLVTFNLNGADGTAPAQQTVTEGENATEPFVPVWTGHAFLGWYTDATAGTKYDFGAVTARVDLYAHWEEVTTPVVIEENATIKFGTAGNFQTYIASTALIGTEVNAQKYRNNGGDNSQLSDTFSIKVKQGATITVSSYSGYTHYNVEASGATTTEQTGTSYEFTVAANDSEKDYATVTFVCGGNNYFYSIKVTYAQPKISTTTTLDLTGNDFADGVGMDSVKFTSGKFSANGGKVFIDNGTVIEIAVEGNPEVSFLWYNSENEPQYGTDANASVDKSVSGKIIITFTQGTDGGPGSSGMYLKSITLTFA